jgi:GcrA cell cycle regulator
LGAGGLALDLPGFTWSEGRVALLKQRWAEGLSASTIAKELGPGVSRCAVLGKIHRLKLLQPEFKRRDARKEGLCSSAAARRARPQRPRRRGLQAS